MVGAAASIVRASSQDGPITLVDATEAFSLIEPLRGMHGHAVAVGDVNGDGWTDLFVGTFADRPADAYALRGAKGPSPDRLLLGSPRGFRGGADLPIPKGRTSGAAFADLDGDGDLDLVVARNARRGRPDVSYLLTNDGTGTFTVLAEIAPGMGARSLAVFDADGDGRLDLFVAEDRWTGGSSKLFRNRGKGVFEVDLEAFPSDLHGLGVAAADFNGDYRPDLFVAGSNRLFLNDGTGFVEVDSQVFEWEIFGNEDDVAGVAVADVDRDGRLDILLGQHFNSTLDFDRRVPVRLYRNIGRSSSAAVAFEDITTGAGLTGLTTKSPHVELADLDNDGWLDIVTTAGTRDGAGPLVFRGRGSPSGGNLRFDSAGDSGRQYWVCGATFDVDHDGRLDVLVVEWEPSRPTKLLRNESSAGGWIAVTVALDDRPAIGSRVEIYAAGRAGDIDALLGAREISATVGYCSGSTQTAHFGIGDVSRVDIVVRAPWTGEVHERRRVSAGRAVCVGDAC